MAFVPVDHRFQHLKIHTHSPIRMDYNQSLPPLADQPLLELRRPGNKDACFTVSALSPKVSKRIAGDWDSMSARASLMDRYLGQQAYSPIIEDILQSPSEPTSQPPSTPGFPSVPAKPKDLWTLMSRRRGPHSAGKPPLRIATDSSQRLQTHYEALSPDIASPTVLAGQQQPNPRVELDHASVARLESLNTPQTRSIIPESQSTIPLVKPATRNLTSVLEDLKNFPRSIESPIGMTPKTAERLPSVHPPSARLSKLVTKIRSEHVDDLDSPSTSSNRSLVYSPSPTIFSPVTPVAMTFEYPIIFDNTPGLTPISWCDNMEILEQSPQDTVVTADDNRPRGRSFDRDVPDSSQSRARSHSTPKSAFPSDSPVYLLPSTVYNSKEIKDDPVRPEMRDHRDDFDLDYEVAEMERNMALNDEVAEIRVDNSEIDRTTFWVMCETLEVEEKNPKSLGTIMSDREAILRSYFHRF